MTGDGGRVVAVDYGRRRIGVAVSDPTRTLVSPRDTVENGDPPSEPPERLLRLLRELEPEEIVVGIPLDMDGTTGEMAEEVREFAENLRAGLGLEVPVAEWDERLTTEQARDFLREGGTSPTRRGRDRGRLDRAAAAVLLRRYLAAR